MRNDRGFTLVEILASIVIIGVLVTVFFQLFVFSQKTTTDNKEKLVAVNIAQGVLEQIKKDPDNTYLINGHDSRGYSYCDGADTDCKKIYTKKFNNKNYYIDIEVFTEVDGVGLHTVRVIVKGDDGKTESTVKGLVEL